METKKYLNKLVLMIRVWCADPRNDRRAQSEKEIRKALAGKHPRAAAGAAAQLFAMTVWYGRQGTLMILDGRIDGWAYLDRALHYSYWYARLNENMTLASTAAALLANAILFDHEEMSEWLAVRLTANLEDQVLLGWALSPFAAFMVKLWGIGRGLDVEVARPKVAPLGIYQPIVDTWHREEELRLALRAACDYHLDQTRERNAHSEFLQTPYPLFPVDILVIAAVRDKLRMTTPRLEHPLLSTPLASLPPSWQRPRMGSDPLLEEVIVRAKKDGLLL